MSKVLALYEADLGLIPEMQYGTPSPTHWSDSGAQNQEEPLTIARCDPNPCPHQNEVGALHMQSMCFSSLS